MRDAEFLPSRAFSKAVARTARARGPEAPRRARGRREKPESGIPTPMSAGQLRWRRAWSGGSAPRLPCLAHEPNVPQRRTPDASVTRVRNQSSRFGRATTQRRGVQALLRHRPTTHLDSTMRIDDQVLAVLSTAHTSGQAVTKQPQCTAYGQGGSRVPDVGDRTEPQPLYGDDEGPGSSRSRLEPHSQGSPVHRRRGRSAVPTHPGQGGGALQERR